MKALMGYLGVTVGLVALLIVAGFIGWAIANDNSSGGSSGGSSSATVDPHIANGAHTFVAFACAQCHGEQGKGGVSPDVPALTTIGPSLTAAQLRQIIDHGQGVVADPKKPFMPVWGQVMSDTQVSDVVAYIKAGFPAVPGATPVSVPTGQGDAVAGAALYERYGCVNCHGPNGLGGVPNPSAPDKAIPPLSGADFRGQFNTDAKIIEFIKSGSVLGKQPIVSMPHWGGVIPDAQLTQLAAYINTLK